MTFKSSATGESFILKVISIKKMRKPQSFSTFTLTLERDLRTVPMSILESTWWVVQNLNKERYQEVQFQNEMTWIAEHLSDLTSMFKDW
jgi:hypothetical protein